MATLDEWIQPVVDPEVRAYVGSLVSALGGSSAEESGRYVLGDDALACLKDLKKWLKFYDEKTNRLDVSRCLAEANIVEGDLLEILALWPEDECEDRLKRKLALSCMELLGHLTWPVEFDDESITVNHHRHLPYLRQAQVRYKRAILHHWAKPLRAAVRVALPSIAMPHKERTPRDDGILKLMLFFLRNLAMITIPNDVPSDIDDSEVSRSATIEAFQSQDIFQLLLTLSSGIGDEFSTQDVTIIEVLFHLLKGVEPDKLFMDEVQLAKSQGDELKDVLQKERSMLAGYARHAPSRHNRFGTMVWLDRGEDNYSTIPGQKGLANAEDSLQRMDESKKWNKPKRRGREPEKRNLQNELSVRVHISESARSSLRKFVEDFIDSSFNPLFSHVRKALDSEASRVLDCHHKQFFYLASWFLQAHTARLKAQKVAGANKDHAVDVSEDDDSFNLVAAVLNQETFITLNRFMQRSQDEKSWSDLTSGMKCLTQILLTVQEMSGSPSEDNQEIAENILNRIFYEETTHDRVINILRTYKDQGFAYLDTCTELSHVFLRMLEQYSKQNVDLQVRSRRRARRKRREEGARREIDDTNDQLKDDENSEVEDVAEVQRTAKERRFDFNRFSARFISQGSVDTFVAFTRFYKELNAKQLKRAHRFFYRVAFKMEMSVLIFRVDILKLFYTMIKGPQELDREVSSYKEWEELVRQIFRGLTKKLQERPELMVEMLFSKMSSSIFFLEHGYDKELPKKSPKLPAELEIKDLEQTSEKVAVAVNLLLKEGKSDDLAWIKGVLESALEERKAWEQAEAARMTLEQPPADAATEQALDPHPESIKAPPSIFVKADSKQRRTALSRDNKLQLLLKVLDFERMNADDDADTTWIIPSSSYPTSSTLEEALQHLTRHESSPIELPDGKFAEDFIHVKRKAPPTSRAQRAEFDDDDDDDDDDATSAINTENEDGEPLFPAGGPTSRPSDPSDKDLNDKRHRRRRRHVKSGDNIDDADAEAEAEAARAQRAHARQRAEASKRHKIKSNLFVHESDEEDDAERDGAFFALEESRRRGFGQQVDAVLGKRGSPAADEDEDEDGTRRGQSVEMHDDGDTNGEAQVPRKRSKKRGNFGPDDDDDDDDVIADGSGDGINGITSAIDEENDATMLSDASMASSYGSGGRSDRRSADLKRNRNQNRIRIHSSGPTIGNTGSPAMSRSSHSDTVIESSKNDNKDDDDDDQNHNGNYNSDTTVNTNSNLEEITPLSSQSAEEYGQKQFLPEGQTKNATLRTDVEDERHDRDDARIPIEETSMRKRNVRGGFIIDSDSE